MAPRGAILADPRASELASHVAVRVNVTTTQLFGGSQMRSFSPKFGRRLVSSLLILTLFAAPAVAEEDEEASSTNPHWGEVAFDIGVLRTLGAVQTVVGLGMFAVAGPLSWPGGSWREAWDVFVQSPYDETFTRKLGRF